MIFKKLFAVLAVAGLAACSQGGDYQGEYYDEAPAETQFIGMVQDNGRPGGMVDETAAAAINAKWNGTDVDVRFEEFRGRMVRVQTILSDADLKEMRLRLMPSANGGQAGMKGEEIIEKVAEFSSKRICGQGVRSVNIVYDQASPDAVQPTPYFDFRADNATGFAREFGFTCEY